MGKRPKKAARTPKRKAQATVREKILGDLKRKKDYTSGQELAKRLGITRAAIWKHISTLRREGHNIESHRREGYRLVSTPKRKK